MDEPTRSAQSTLELPVDAIAPDPNQPRTTFSEEDLAELAESIRANQLIQPIVVTPHPDLEAREVTPYMILVGERRWRATRLAELPTIPAILRSDEISLADRLLLQIAENDERSDLSLLDRALAYQRAHKLSQLSQTAFAKRCGMAKTSVSHLLRIAEAEGLTREALEEDLLHRADTVRVFERLSPEAQLRLLSTARRTLQPITSWRVQAVLDRESKPEETEATPPADEGAEDLEPPSSAPALSRRSDPSSSAAAETVTITLTYAELKDLLRFLGARPLPTAKAAAEQLVKILSASAAA